MVSDGEGDKAWGYIDLADSAQALGSELTPNNTAVSDGQTEANATTSWVQAATPTTFESTSVGTPAVGTYHFHAVGDGTLDGFYVSTTTTAGKLYKISYRIKVVSGTVGVQAYNSVNDTLWTSLHTSSSYAQVTNYATALGTDTRLYVRQWGATAAEWYLDDVSVKEVTDVGTDGVHIMSTKGGSTQSWAGISASFNYNASAYTFEVRETEFQITGNLTVGAWVKGTSYTTSDKQIIAKATSYNSNNAFRLGYLGYADPKRFVFDVVTDANQAPSTTTPVSDTWYHVVGVYNDSHVYIYVNGALEGSDTAPASLTDTDISFYVGAQGAGPQSWPGTIDEPFVISSALTADQIKALYEYYTISTSHIATKTTPANSADGTNDTNYHIYSLISQSSLSSLIQDSTTLSTSSTNLPAVAQYARLQNTDTTNALSVDWIAVIKPATASPTTSLSSTEEQGGGPVAYWKFDEGQGTVAHDSTANANNGTLGTGSSAPSWQSEDMCVSGKCLKFDNIDDTVSVTNSISGIKTVSFWVKPNTTTEYFVDLNGSAYISATAGAISATGFTTPIYYVNGKSVTSPILTANQWNYITVTTTTGLTGSAIRLGKIGTNHLQGFLDDVKIYPYARSAAQIKLDYNGRGVAKGASVKISSSSAGISNGLVGYWNMDTGSGTTAPDLSGNGNTATLGAGDSAPAWASAKYGSGLSFDGNDYARVTNASSIEPTEELTYSAWIYPTSVSGNNAIVSKNDVNVSAWRIKTLYLNGDEVYFWVFNGSGQYFNTTNADFVINTWYHITATVKDNNFVKIYVNGIEKYSNTAVGDLLLTENEDLMIGANLNTNIPGYLFDGLIDEVRIYNRALSGKEVRDLYAWAPGPVAHFKLDEGSGTSPVDSSGFSRTGTVVNGLWTTGKVGKGLKLDGTGDYLQITDF